MKVKLTAKQQIFADVYNFVLSTDRPLAWEAGQYMRYQLAHSSPDDRGESRFFTISSAPFEKNLSITTRILPTGSTFKKKLLSLKPGDSFEAFGPNGKFIIPKIEQPIVCIAGGIGITPFRSMIVDLDHKNLPVPITLLYANKNDAVVFQEELEEISTRHPEFKIEYFIGDSHITESTIQPLISHLTHPTFYISGPEGMMKSFVEMLQKLGVAEENIKHDFFPGYDD